MSSWLKTAGLGIITPRDIARWIRRSQELGLTESDV